MNSLIALPHVFTLVPGFPKTAHLLGIIQLIALTQVKSLGWDPNNRRTRSTSCLRGLWPCGFFSPKRLLNKLEEIEEKLKKNLCDML